MGDSKQTTYCHAWAVFNFRITVDNHEVFRENIGAGGFWQRGGFGGNNLWSGGTKAAPFDQPVGGTSISYDRCYFI